MEINSAKFSNLLDAIIDVSNKYDINVSSADIYLHQDDDDGYVAGKLYSLNEPLGLIEVNMMDIQVFL